MKIFDLSHDSIELHARPTRVLKRLLHDDDPRLAAIPEGYVEVIAVCGGERLVFWFTPENAHKLSIAFEEKMRQCRDQCYDPEAG